jgi:hypothetical protein
MRDSTSARVKGVAPPAGDLANANYLRLSVSSPSASSISSSDGSPGPAPLPPKKDSGPFLGAIFKNIDNAIAAFKLVDDTHPLAELLFEAVASVREIANCWMVGRLHAVAVDSLRVRAKKIRRKLDSEMSLVAPTICGWLDKKSKRGWLTRHLTVRLHHIFSSQSSETKLIDCHAVTAVHELHNGSPEFLLTLRINGHPKSFQYRTRTDSERQKWLSFFRLWRQQNRAVDAMNRMSISHRAEITASVFRPFANTRLDNFNKSREFLFSTIGWALTDEDEESRVLAPPPASSVGPVGPVITSPPPMQIIINHSQGLAQNEPPSPMPSFIPPVAILSPSPALLEVKANSRRGVCKKIASWHMERPRFGLTERFKVAWPQTIGKDKQREIEIDLNIPRRILFYKAHLGNQKGSGLVLAPDQPDIVFSRSDLLDYQLVTAKHEIILYFNALEKDGKGRFKRSFVFPTHASFCIICPAFFILHTDHCQCVNFELNYCSSVC